MRMSYDKDADVLYVWFVSIEPPYTNIENKNGDVVRVSQKEGAIVGLIVMNAMKRMRSGEPLDFPEVAYKGHEKR